LALSPRIDRLNELRAVLSWNALPRDLDLHSSHMTACTVNNGRTSVQSTKLCSVGYQTPSCGSVDHERSADVGGDVGSESQQIYPLSNTVYQFYVNKYQGQAAIPTLYNSGAQIDIYSGSSDWAIATIPIPGSNPRDPTGSMTWWNSFCIDGTRPLTSTGIRVVTLNTFSTNRPNYSTNCTFIN